MQLLTDEPFTRKDVIMLQDPLNLDKKDGQSITAPVPSLATAVRSDPFKERTVSKFDYVRRALKVDEDQGALSGINVEASGIGRVLKTLEKGKQDKAEVRMRAYDRAVSCSASRELTLSASRRAGAGQVGCCSRRCQQGPFDERFGCRFHLVVHRGPVQPSSDQYESSRRRVHFD